MTRAVVATAFGGPEVLEVQQAPSTEPGPGEVAVKVRAVGTNPIDYKLYSGQMGNDPSTLPIRPGLEAAGVVVAVGAGSRGLTGPVQVGDEVICTDLPGGGYTDRLVMPAADVAAKPAGLSFEEAAGLLCVAGTAEHLVHATGVQSGDIVLIHGGAGSVGAAAVQLALLRGAKVIATASKPRHEMLRALGAIPVEYGPGLADRVRAIGPVDVALDTVGTDEAVDVSVELVADRSRIASIVAFARGPALGIQVLSGADGGQQFRSSVRTKLIDLAGEGKLTVAVDRTLPLEQAADAHRYLQTGHAKGKVILVP